MVNRIWIAILASAMLMLLDVSAQAAPQQSSCVQSASSGWTNTPLSTQAAPFTATYDATPSRAKEDVVTGFSLNASSDYTNLAAITRFADTGTIDARDGGNYSADVSVPYSAGVSYHFRMVINPGTKRYDVYVTPPGQSEIALAVGYAFRSEQSSTSTLNNWGMYALSGSQSICNMAISFTSKVPAITTQPASQTITAGQTATFAVVAGGTAPLSYQWRKNGASISGATASSYTTPAATTADSGTQFSVLVSNSAGSASSASAMLTVNATASCVQSSVNAWTNSAFPMQTGNFAATFDAIPNQAKMDGTFGFSLNAANGYTDLAAIAEFANTGTIKARNAGTYSADVAMPYVAGSSYHFRMVIRPGTERYDVFVTAPGQAETALATNYAFRSEQSSTSSLNNWAATTTVGTQMICNMAITAGVTAAPPVITTQPVSQMVVAGQTASFSVTATGTAPFSYQWRKNGANISGATAATYTAPAAISTDNGALFSVTVSNSAGSTTSANAVLSVNATATKLLSASPSSINFGNVTIALSSPLTFTITNTGNANVTISRVSISGAGLTISGLSTGQIISSGQSVIPIVVFLPLLTGSVSGSVTVTSDASNSPLTVSITGTGLQLISHTTSLSWGASSSAVMGYNVYSGTASGGPYTKLSNSLITGITFKDSTVQSGKTYYYVVTAVNSSNVESAYSSQVSAAIP